MATYELPATENERYAALAVLNIVRKLTDNIIGLRYADVTINDIADDLTGSLRRLVNDNGQPSEGLTAAAGDLHQFLTRVTTE